MSSSFGPRDPAEPPLGKDALRLLEALNGSGALGRADPVEPGPVLVSRSTSGLSLSAGRFDGETVAILVGRGLASWSTEKNGSMILRITPAGHSKARRASVLADPHPARRPGPEGAVMITDEGRAYLLADPRESPLEWLHRRRGRDGRPLIEEASYQAGEKFRVDITLAGMLPGITSRWEEPVSGARPGEATDRMVAARQRVRHALDALGADFGDLLTDLCGFLKGLERIEQERGWPPRSAKVVIGLALRRLADHYGLQGSAGSPNSAPGIRAWRAIVIEGGRS